MDFDDGFFGNVKGSECEDLCVAWTKVLSDLQQEHSLATKRILAHYDASKAKLKQWRDDLLQQQSVLLAEQESQLTEIYDK